MKGFVAMIETAIWRAGLDAMVRRRRCSHDAFHVAMARSVDGRSFATLDADFRRVPDPDGNLPPATVP